MTKDKHKQNQKVEKRIAKWVDKNVDVDLLHLATLVPHDTKSIYAFFNGGPNEYLIPTRLNKAGRVFQYEVDIYRVIQKYSKLLAMKNIESLEPIIIPGLVTFEKVEVPDIMIGKQALNRLARKGYDYFDMPATYKLVPIREITTRGIPLKFLALTTFTGKRLTKEVLTEMRRRYPNGGHYSLYSKNLRSNKIVNRWKR